MGELVDSIAAYNNSANAIGFSVYYYIDQMYSQPGLRLLAVDGVTPFQRHHRQRKLPAVQRVLCRSPCGRCRRQPGTPALRLAGYRRRTGLHQKIRLCSGGTRHRNHGRLTLLN